MVKQNRKRQGSSQGVFFPAPLVSVAVLLSAAALAYIWLGCQCEAVGKAIKGLESEQMILRQQLSNEQGKWAEMRSVANIERALVRNAVAMTPPRPGQIVQLRGRFYEGWVEGASYAARVARVDRPVSHD
jgi:hypothetical protein